MNLLIEAHREYLDALQSRNTAGIQAWRNSLDLELLNLAAVQNSPNQLDNLGCTP